MATFAGEFWYDDCEPGIEMQEKFTVFIGSASRYIDAGCAYSLGCEKMLIPRALHIIDCESQAELDASGLLTELFETYF